MENNDGSQKPQQTGGLKLMTVMIGVLALHVVVIGGITAYELLKGGSTDADLVTDKTHKTVKVSPDGAVVSDGQLADAAAADKTTGTPTTPADTTSNPVTIPAPTQDGNQVAASPAPTTPSTPAPSVPNSPAPTVATTSQPAIAVPSNANTTGPVIAPPTSSPTPAPAPAPEVATENTAPTQLDGNLAGGTTYLVKAHDTLAKIAHRHHVKLAAIRSANGLLTDKVHAGQKLIIPAHAQVATVKEPSETAPRSGPDRTLLGDSPSISKKVAGGKHDKTAMASTSGHHVYTVAKGDTLNRIAKKFHTSPGALMSLNNIGDARKLHPGQKLRIPSQESRSATSAPAATHPDRIEPRATPSAQLANFIN